MEPRNIGRALGIGLRVAGRVAGKRIAAPAPSTNGPATADTQSASSAQSVSGAQPVTNTQSVPTAQAFGAAAGRLIAQARPPAEAAASTAAQSGRNVSQGIGGFLRPFRRVGGIVWLEATGTFFLLFAALFILRLWQNWTGISRVSRDFSMGAAVVFLYLGVSSFWRARRG